MTMLSRCLLAGAAALGLPAPDPEPWRDGNHEVALFWRAHYVCALFAGSNEGAVRPLEDRGFEVVVFGNETTWSESFRGLAAALGVR